MTLLSDILDMQICRPKIQPNKGKIKIRSVHISLDSIPTALLRAIGRSIRRRDQLFAPVRCAGADSGDSNAEGYGGVRINQAASGKGSL